MPTSLEMFLTRAVNDIMRGAPRKQTRLKQYCAKCLELFKECEMGDLDGTDLNVLIGILPTLIKTLQLACNCRSPKIMATALDTVQKLLAYGYIRGTVVLPEEEQAESAVKIVVAIISSCFDSHEPAVHLQVLKAFLTAVTSPKCELHGSALLSAVRVCYNVCLVSHDQINAMTARGTLTQILGCVFSRLEQLQCPKIPELEPDAEEHESSPPPYSIDSSLSDSPSSESVSQPVLPTSPAPTVSFAEQLAKDIFEDVFNSALDRVSPSSSTSELEITWSDCFQLFRALCKLSIKDGSTKGSSEPAPPIALKSKVLSLELLFHILDNAGSAFRNDSRMVELAIRKHLWNSLLHNAVSTVPRVFKLSLGIFVRVFRMFKEQLKKEVGIFFTNIFLRLLESPSSSVQQKWMVLQDVLKICREPQTLVDLFLNYDCDIEWKSGNIFERMAEDLSKVAQGNPNVDNWTTASQDLALRTLALECVVSMMRSLVEWSSSEDEEDDSGSIVSDDVPDDHLDLDEKAPTSPFVSVREKEVSQEEMDQFQATLAYKQLVEEGKVKFNSQGPRNGIEHWVRAGLCPNTERGIAECLFHNLDGLDKQVLGNFMGGSKDFNKKVLKEFVDTCSFKDQEIDEALRDLMGMFLMPGEAGVLDRLMICFGARYFKDNPRSIFADADAVYKLAYAIMMLATSLHNPKVKKEDRLQFPTWVKMVNNDLLMNLETDYLRDVYDRIASKELVLSDSHMRKQSGLTEFLNQKQKRAHFKEESSGWIDTSKKAMETYSSGGGTYYHTNSHEYARPMFESSWAPAFVAFSVLLERSEDPKVIELCLFGFRHAVHIASVFILNLQRTTFVSALEKLTLLNNLREMKPKNVGAIKTLINIASADAYHLLDSWEVVLRCISLLERLHIIGAGGRPESLLLPETPTEQVTHPRRGRRIREDRSADGGGFTHSHINLGAASSAAAASFEAPNSRLIAGEIDLSAIDRIYSDSARLSDSAIIHFVRSLCTVSLEEMKSVSPRIFSLQKVVDVAYHNMGRAMLVWSEMWHLLQSHFTVAGCNDNMTVAMCAIDSLRQLAVKFLEKDELANYHFQKEFLRPFDLISLSTTSERIRELVIVCVQQMVVLRASNIKSGWKCIFAVLTTVAEDERVLVMAFEVVADILKHHYLHVAELFFVECVNCLVAFGKNPLYTEVSLRAIALLHNCASSLTSGRPAISPPSPVEGSSLEEGILFTDTYSHLSVWFPILTGLSGIVSHHHIDVRTGALVTLFAILHDHGHCFSASLWELVFRGVIMPVFDNVGYSARGKETIVATEDSEWLNSTCLNALQSFISIFTQYYSVLKFLLGDVLELLVSFVLQDNEMLADIGQSCMFQLVTDCGSMFSADMWTQVCQQLHAILMQNVEIFQSVVVFPEESNYNDERPEGDEMNEVLLVSSTDDINKDADATFKEAEKDLGTALNTDMALHRETNGMDEVFGQFEESKADFRQGDVGSDEVIIPSTSDSPGLGTENIEAERDICESDEKNISELVNSGEDSVPFESKHDECDEPVAEELTKSTEAEQTICESDEKDISETVDNGKETVFVESKHDEIDVSDVDDLTKNTEAEQGICKGDEKDISEAVDNEEETTFEGVPDLELNEGPSHDIQEDSARKTPSSFETEVFGNLKHCGFCGANELEKTLLRCSLCNSAWYCSRHCQSQDWNRHRGLCLPHLKPESPHLKSESPGPSASSLSRIHSVPNTARLSIPGQPYFSPRVKIRSVNGRCQVLLVLIKAIDEIVCRQKYYCLQIQHLVLLLDALACMVDAASPLLDDPSRRGVLCAAGLQVIVLRVEKEALATLLRLLFRMYADGVVPDSEQGYGTKIEASERRNVAEQRLIPLAVAFLAAFLSPSFRDPEARLPLAAQILRGFSGFSDDQYRAHLPRFYLLLAELALHESRELRRLLRVHWLRTGCLFGVLESSDSAEK